MHIEQAAANAAKSVPVSGGRSRGLARRGLAPLELVLSLPIMLLIMALMVNFGTLACWKVRGLSMARLAVWGSRWPRSGDSTPRPAYWPAPGTVGTAGPVNVPQLDDARVDQPVARGPQFMQAQVNTELLDPTRGLRTGSAGLTRQYPMLGKLPQFQLTANTYMLDDRWQYPQMNMGSNTDHRIPILYTLPEAPDKYLNAYVQAYMNIINAPFQPQLQPLDNDPDFLAFQGSAPDFYPRLALFCSAGSRRGPAAHAKPDQPHPRLEKTAGRQCRPGHGASVHRPLSADDQSLQEPSANCPSPKVDLRVAAIPGIPEERVMRAENHPAPGQAACQGTASPAPQRSFGLLARRISAWTTNGLLTVIILVVGLVFGRQVLRWWAADAPRSNAASATPRIGQGLGDPSQPHVLQFGNQPWSLREQVIGGDRQAAAAALLADCRRFLQSAPAPAGAAGSDRAARARNAEVLATLRQLKPTEEERGKWRLYQLPNDLPMVAGVRQDAAATQGRAASKLAEGTPAVVIWGLAIPRARQAWTLYTFQPESDAGQPNSGLASIPIPPGSCRIMAMQVAEGGGLPPFRDRTAPSSGSNSMTTGL